MVDSTPPFSFVAMVLIRFLDFYRRPSQCVRAIISAETGGTASPVNVMVQTNERCRSEVSGEVGNGSVSYGFEGRISFSVATCRTSISHQSS